MSKLTKITICKVLEIDAGHRIYGHENKCANLHGHRYKFEIHARANDLDSLGRVVDFGVIKSKIGGWLNNYWDHGMILWEEDPIAIEWKEDTLEMMECQTQGSMYGNKIFLLQDNPTAENLAKQLLSVSRALTNTFEIDVFKVGCWETPTCYAEATND